MQADAKIKKQYTQVSEVTYEIKFADTQTDVERVLGNFVASGVVRAWRGLNGRYVVEFRNYLDSLKPRSELGVKSMRKTNAKAAK